jgi:hypothetical protein
VPLSVRSVAAFEFDDGGCARSTPRRVAGDHINPDRPGGLVNFTDAVNAEPAAPPTTTIAPTTTVQNIATPSGGSTAEPAPPQDRDPHRHRDPVAVRQPGAIQIVVGAGDENGTRLKMNLETPSLNSFIYEFMEPSC